ncbi:uncharacterized protein LOC115228928 [Octopus sinensis]|uniref:Uncharacterized protein LOC115228928 n=1 Tax=Octopus sinensis TaxID=2607531 RepID=A0A6P7TU11_9MOLL|nr:uncharacterized protein LOC115228928 [Octopus sinensis]
MITWINLMESSGAILSDSMLITKALKNDPEFKASRGWLEKCKLRNGIKLKKFHGDSGSVNHDEKYIADFNETISLIIEQYGLDNVYNSDKTDVFYKAILSKSVCTKPRPGIKLSKDRFSLLIMRKLFWFR